MMQHIRSYTSNFFGRVVYHQEIAKAKGVEENESVEVFFTNIIMIYDALQTHSSPQYIINPIKTSRLLYSFSSKIMLDVKLLHIKP